MHFDVMSGIPSLAANALKGGDRSAVQRQSESEHRELLDPSSLPGYAEAMMMPPGPQKNLALSILQREAQAREASVPRWWEDEMPRRPISQSSSWISGIDYDPYSGYLRADIRNGRGSISLGGVDPRTAAEIVDSNSIGRSILSRS